MVPPSPNCPLESRPQHGVAVVKDGAGVLASSIDRNGRAARAEVDGRGGRCGDVRVASTIAQLSVGVISQHFRSPLSRMTQACSRPADTATAVRPVPRSIGVDEGDKTLLVAAPLPNCPLRSFPQHFRSPLSRMAHVNHPPAETATAVRPVPRSTEAGECTATSLVPPSPTCPLESRPQHFSSPLSRMTQVCSYPADTARAVRPVYRGQSRPVEN